MRVRTIRAFLSCFQVQHLRAAEFGPPGTVVRTFFTTPPLASGQAAAKAIGQDEGRKDGGKGESAMSRRLAEMTEESIDLGGSSAANNVEAAGFSEELKRRLEARITDNVFRSQNQRAFTEAELPVWYLTPFHDPLARSLHSIDLGRQRDSRSSNS
jgi:hypothetical protein